MADKKPSSGDVLRALAEEVRGGNIHPDRASILDAFLEDQDKEREAQQDDQAPAEGGAGEGGAPRRQSDHPEGTQKESSTTAPDAAGGKSGKAGK